MFCAGGFPRAEELALEEEQLEMPIAVREPLLAEESDGPDVKSDLLHGFALDALLHGLAFATLAPGELVPPLEMGADGSAGHEDGPPVDDHGDPDRYGPRFGGSYPGDRGRR